MNKLKPCPFCNGKAKIYYDYSNFALVQCTKCGISTLHKPNEHEVIKDWNTRYMESYVEQLRWERDVAISQLEGLGIGFGEAEEQGLLLKLPCKIGTTAYVVGTRCLAGEEPEEGCTFLDCDECIYDKTYTVFERKVDNMMMYHFLVGDNENFIFNKTVFLTKEAAEQELKRLECAE